MSSGPARAFVDIFCVPRGADSGRRAICDRNAFGRNPFFRRGRLLGRSVARVPSGSVSKYAARCRAAHGGRPGGGIAHPGRLPSHGRSERNSHNCQRSRGHAGAIRDGLCHRRFGRTKFKYLGHLDLQELKDPLPPERLLPNRC